MEAVNYIANPNIFDILKREQILKEQNRALEKYNASLEQMIIERQQQCDQTRCLLNMNPDGMLVINHNSLISLH